MLRPLKLPWRLLALVLALAWSGGCQTPSHTGEGAVLGGLLGAGTGAIVGHAAGNTGAGAAIGAGVGALGGAAVGNSMDQAEKDRAMIAQQLGRQVGPGAVKIDDVVAMTRAGVNEGLIINHVRANGMAAPLQSADLIRLQQEGISPNVIATMQAPPPQPVVVQQPAPPPVIVQERPYYGPYYYPPRYYRPPPPGFSMTIH